MLRFLKNNNFKKITYLVLALFISNLFANLGKITEAIGSPKLEYNQDLENLSKNLGKDPQKIFEYVRDKIDYQPYNGLLRSPLGTLWSKAGNSVDKSLLLFTLLKKAGYKCQFGVGELTNESKEKISKQITGKINSTFIDFLKNPNLSKKLNAQQKKKLNEIQKNILQLIKNIGDDSKNTLPLNNMNPHVWVRYKEGKNWIDLDPSFSKASLGNIFVSSTKYFDELPSELFWDVEIRFMINDNKEVWKTNVSSKIDWISNPLFFSYIKDRNTISIRVGDKSKNISISNFQKPKIVIKITGPSKESKIYTYNILSSRLNPQNVLNFGVSLLITPYSIPNELVKNQHKTISKDELNKNNKVKNIEEFSSLVSRLTTLFSLLYTNKVDESMKSINDKLPFKLYYSNPRLIISSFIQDDKETRFNIVPLTSGINVITHPKEKVSTAYSIMVHFELIALTLRDAIVKDVTQKPVVSPIQAIINAKKQKIPIKIIHKENLVEVNNFALSNKTKNAIKEKVNQGYIVITPIKAVKLASSHEAFIAILDLFTTPLGIYTFATVGSRVTVMYLDADDAYMESVAKNPQSRTPQGGTVTDATNRIGGATLELIKALGGTVTTLTALSISMSALNCMFTPMVKSWLGDSYYDKKALFGEFIKECRTDLTALSLVLNTFSIIDPNFRKQTKDFRKGLGILVLVVSLYDITNLIALI